MWRARLFLQASGNETCSSGRSDPWRAHSVLGTLWRDALGCKEQENPLNGFNNQDVDRSHYKKSEVRSVISGAHHCHQESRSFHLCAWLHSACVQCLSWLQDGCSSSRHCTLIYQAQRQGKGVVLSYIPFFFFFEI